MSLVSQNLDYKCDGSHIADLHRDRRCDLGSLPRGGGRKIRILD